MVSLFIKGFIIGIGKIIPGISGAMIAVSFGVYDRMIEAITHFFDDTKNNFKFLLVLGMGIVLSIVCFSNIVSYFLNNNYLVTMMFFIGLITGGTYEYSRNIDYSFRDILIILFVVFLMMFISLGSFNNEYVIKGNYIDYLMFFIGGVIEIFASLVPGISGTALMMLMGIYDKILVLLSNVMNVSYVIDNIIIYISYGFGMVVSFIFCSLVISYLLKKYRRLFDTIIVGLSISSIMLLILMAFRGSFVFIDMIIGIVIFFLGIYISYLCPR